MGSFVQVFLQVVPTLVGVAMATPGAQTAHVSAAGGDSEAVVIAALIGAVAGLLGGLLVSIVGSYVSHRLQAKRDIQAYEHQRMRDDVTRKEERWLRVASYRRAVQDAKRKRLLEAYQVILLGAWAWQSAVGEMQRVSAADGTEANRDRRVGKYVAKELAPVNRAMIVVELEDIGSDVAGHFYELRKAFTGYMVSVGIRQQYAGSAGAASDMRSLWEDMERYKQTVDTTVDELTRAMHTRLRELEQTNWMEEGMEENSGGNI